jgi:hypothetical protein
VPGKPARAARCAGPLPGSGVNRPLRANPPDDITTLHERASQPRVFDAVAKLAGVGTGTVQRVRSEMTA